MMSNDLNKDVNIEHQSVDGGFDGESPDSTLHPSGGEDVSMGSGGQPLINAATEGTEPGDGDGEVNETTLGVGVKDGSGEATTGKGGVSEVGLTFGIKRRGVSTADGNQPNVKGKKAIIEEPKNSEDAAGDDLQLSEGSLSVKENEDFEENGESATGGMTNAERINQRLLYKLVQDMDDTRSTMNILLQEVVSNKAKTEEKDKEVDRRMNNAEEEIKKTGEAVEEVVERMDKWEQKLGEKGDQVIGMIGRKSEQAETVLTELKTRMEGQMRGTAKDDRGDGDQDRRFGDGVQEVGTRWE